MGAAGVALVDGGVLTMVSYRAVLPWRLQLTLWFVGAEAVLPVSVSVMPVVRSLWVSLWFSASRTLPMLVVVGVGLCVGGPRLAFRAVVGFCGSVWGACAVGGVVCWCCCWCRWRRCCSRWCRG